MSRLLRLGRIVPGLRCSLEGYSLDPAAPDEPEVIVHIPTNLTLCRHHNVTMALVVAKMPLPCSLLIVPVEGTPPSRGINCHDLTGPIEAEFQRDGHAMFSQRGQSSAVIDTVPAEVGTRKERGRV